MAAFDNRLEVLVPLGCSKCGGQGIEHVSRLCEMSTRLRL
jgi:hypothetical protein